MSSIIMFLKPHSVYTYPYIIIWYTFFTHSYNASVLLHTSHYTQYTVTSHQPSVCAATHSLFGRNHRHFSNNCLFLYNNYKISWHITWSQHLGDPYWAFHFIFCRRSNTITQYKARYKKAIFFYFPSFCILSHFSLFFFKKCNSIIQHEGCGSKLWWVNQV